MSYIKSKGGLIQRETRLFAPMLSTFGGGSARGFNPGGASFEPFYISRSSSVSTDTTFQTTQFMTSGWGYGGGNADGGVINWSGTGTYTITALSIGYAQNTSSPNSAGVRVRITQGSNLNGTVIHTETVPFQNSFNGSSYPGRAAEIPISGDDFSLNRGTSYSVAIAFVTTDLPNYNTFALDGSSDNCVTSRSVPEDYGGGTITFVDTNYNGPDPFDAGNGTTFSSGKDGQLQIFGLKRLS